MSTPSLDRMMRELVATPSVSSILPAWDQSNLPVLEKLAHWLRPLGFKVEISPIADRDGHHNLIATLGRGEGGLVLAGHTDTVPYDDRGWDTDPFALTERDGRLAGLGASDMKLFLAMAIEAAKDFSAGQLKQPLIILATADEESGMSGARSLAEGKLFKARHVVIGEPTNMHPVRAHKGVMMEGVRIQGKSGHASDPRLGRNALEGMTAVLNRLLQWRETLKQRYNDPQFEVPYPTLNLGYLHAGDNPNRICSHAELHIDMRPLPGMSVPELREALNQEVAAAAGSDQWPFEVVPLFPGIEAMTTAPDAELVRAVEALTGEQAGSVAFGTEGPFFSQMGMDVVIMGPGEIEQAHQPNESLPVDHIEPTVKRLRQLIQHFCVEDGHG